jgi:hypothetical protein
MKTEIIKQLKEKGFEHLATDKIIKSYYAKANRNSKGDNQYFKIAYIVEIIILNEVTLKTH